MKASRVVALVLLAVTGSSIRGREGRVVAAPPAPGGAGYDVAVQSSQVGGQSTWRYTITKTSPQAKDLGHFILDLASCGGQGPTMADIVSATVNGVDWSEHLETSEGPGPVATSPRRTS